MLIGALAHAGAPLAPHDLWWAWDPEPLLVLALGLSAWAWIRGRASRHGTGGWTAASWWAGLGLLAVAVLSPLDALSGQLASAHMVQHVLLSLVAPPLLVLASPGHRLQRGVPLRWRRRVLRWQHRAGLPPARLRALRSPGLAWLLTVGALWFWHGAVPYDAAVRHEAVHALEHASFFVTGLLFWAAVLPAGRQRDTAPAGFGVLLLFTMATQSTLLAALLTFAGTPWYDSYLDTAPAWGLDALADQQLAGVIMWVPAGLIYPLAAVLVLAVWLRTTDERTGPGAPAAATAVVSRS